MTPSATAATTATAPKKAKSTARTQAKKPTTTTEARPPLTRKELVAEHPTWCPGCGDFSILSSYYKLIERRKLLHEKVVTIAGIGCSSRLPYFVQAHGVHFIHGRALPFASGLTLSRPDLHVFVFGGDGDAFSIGGNHFNHTARKNLKMTYVVMDNWVYGLTKKQTSPTSPPGFKSKTDIWGAVDYPINPIKQAIAAGATFVARTTHTNPGHVLQTMEAALDHDGFSFIECLSECVEFYPAAFNASNPRKGGEFRLIPEDHDAGDEASAYRLAGEPFPGYFGLFYQVKRPTKNALEAGIVERLQAPHAECKPWELLQQTFDRMR